MNTFLLGVLVGFIGGVILYRYLLDKPDTLIKTDKVKQKGTVNSDQNVNIDKPKRKGFLFLKRRANKQK